MLDSAVNSIVSHSGEKSLKNQDKILVECYSCHYIYDLNKYDECPKCYSNEVLALGVDLSFNYPRDRKRRQVIREVLKMQSSAGDSARSTDKQMEKEHESL